MLLFGLCLGCSKTTLHRFEDPSLRQTRAEEVAVLPLFIFAASKTDVATTYTPDWYTGDVIIDQTRVTKGLSSGEVLPAEEAMMEALRKELSGISLVSPRDVNRTMKGAAAKSIEDAAAIAVARTKAPVLVVTLRDVATSGGEGVLGGPAAGKPWASCVVNVELRGNGGDVLWSVSGNILLATATVFNSTPTVPELVAHAFDELDSDLEELAKALRRGEPFVAAEEPPRPLPPAAAPPRASPGCGADIECKGDRICVEGACVDPE